MLSSSSVPNGYAAIKIYTRTTHGRFDRLRWIMVWVTQLVFYALPWLSWNQCSAVLFDLGARRFYLFNLVLYPQDLIYLTLLLIISALGLFFVTTLAGRIWCGFACPQTVYTKLFMWVEHKTEGERSARMRLDAAPWSMDKIARKTTKQLLWIAISLWTGFTFVAYFTPLTSLTQGAVQGGWSAWESFWIFFYALALYGNAGYLREQVCKHMCPYARFQSAMFDKDTLIIGYDTQRGDPRGSRQRTANAKALGLGDCIDCTLCVQVCPTGIDIWDGLQSDCIGCAACIDACDVMHALEHAQHYSIRVSGPQGLQLSADSPDSVMLEPVGERLVPLAVHLPAEQAVALAGQNVPIAFHIQPEDSQDDAHAITEVSRFIVPK